MRNSSLAPTVLVEEPCFFEIRDGLVYVHYESVGVTLAFRPQTFYRNFANAAQCMQDCNAQPTAEIIEVEFDSKFERVYPRNKSA